MLGQRLAEARKRAGLMQVELAVALGDRYDQTMISHVERGRSALLLDGAVQAASELDVSLDYLVGLTDDPTPSAELAAKLDALADPEGLAGVSAEIHQFPGTKPIGVYRLGSAAGSGALDLDETIKTYAWFRQEWLSRKGLIAERCGIISVEGESMEPTLPDGCVILMDRNRTRLRSNRIFVLRTEDGLIVKRAGRNGRRWLMVSDNDNGDWPTLPWPREAKVIGQVVWSAQELLL